MRLMIAAAALMIGGAAMAADSVDSATSTGPAMEDPSATAKGKGPLDKMVCKSISLSGSMLDRKKVCMTRLQWEEQRRRDRDWIDRAQTTQMNKGG
jgi:hypothetical protein